MTAYSNQGPFTLEAGADLKAFRFVRIQAGKAVYAGAGDEPIGVVVHEVDNGMPASIRPMAGDIQKITVTGTIESGAALYVGANGVASGSAVGKQIGINLTAAAANDVIPAIIWGPRGGNDVFSPTSGIFDFKDDFVNLDITATNGLWAEVSDGSGVRVPIGGHGGWLRIRTAASSTNDTLVYSLFKNWKFQADKKLYFETRMKAVESVAGKCIWGIGLADHEAVDMMQDGTGGPAADYDGALLYRVEDSSKIGFQTSNSTSKENNASLADYVAANTYTLGFLYDYNDGTTAKVTPFVNGVAGDVEDLTISGLSDMGVVMAVKCASATLEEINVDYVKVIAER